MERKNVQGNWLQIRPLQQSRTLEQPPGSSGSIRGHQLAKADEKRHGERLLLATRVQGVREGLRASSETAKEMNACRHFLLTGVVLSEAQQSDEVRGEIFESACNATLRRFLENPNYARLRFPAK